MKKPCFDPKKTVYLRAGARFCDGFPVPGRFHRAPQRILSVTNRRALLYPLMRTVPLSALCKTKDL